MPSGKILVNGQDINIGEEIYSTEETKIGTWIDGKPLYRKCYITKLPTTVSNTWQRIPTEVEGIDAVIFIRATLNYNGECIPLTTVNLEGKMCKVHSNMNDNTLRIFNNIDVYTGMQLYITIEYTKITDEVTIV